MANAVNSIKLSSVEITHDRLSELDGKQAIKSIRKDEIVNISLAYGFCSERPVRQIICGILTALTGLYLGLIPTGKVIYDVYSHTGVDVGHPFSKGLFFIVFPSSVRLRACM